MVTYGIDRSHWNAMPDFVALKAGGVAFVLNKGTDGSGYEDPSFEACRAGAKAAGLVFGSYHFAEWGDPTTEANYFLARCKPQPGELVALDAEAAIPAGVDVVAWVLQWSRVVHGAVNAWPLVYMNQDWLATHNWAAVAALGPSLWLAKYDGLPTGGPVGPWPVLAMKQFTDAAVVAGESGTVDEDAFQGDLAALLKYTIPAPSSDWFAMATQDDLRAVIREFLPANYSAAWPEDMLRRIQSMHLYGFTQPDVSKTAVPVWETGGDLSWLDKREADLATKTAAAVAAAPTPVTLDAASIESLKSAILADPAFTNVITQAAQAVVAQMDADLAKRFGPTP